MKPHKNIIAILLVLLLASLSFSQNPDKIKADLDRLNFAIQQAQQVVELITDFQMKKLVIDRIRLAEQEYQTALNFFNQRRMNLASAHIRLAFQILDSIQKQIRNQPVFRIKFKEQLDNLIQEAEHFVQQNPDPEAIRMLNRAKYFKRRALLFGREGKVYSAMEFYRLAIFFTKATIRLANPGKASDEKNWESRFRETQNLLEEAQALVRESGSPELSQRLRQLETELTNARNLHFKNKSLAANNRLLFVQRSLYRIIDAAERVPQTEKDRLESEYESLSVALQGLEEEFNETPSPLAQRMIQRLKTLMQQIRTNIHQQRWAIASQKLFLANRLIMKVFKLTQTQSLKEPESLAQQLEVTRQNYAELMKADFQSATDRSIADLIRVEIESAEKAMHQGKYAQAAVFLHTSNSLILKLYRSRYLQSQNRIDKETVRNELNRLGLLIQRIEGNKETDLPKRNLNDAAVDTARKLYQIAEKAFEEENYRMSHELIAVAFNLLTK